MTQRPVPAPIAMGKLQIVQTPIEQRMETTVVKTKSDHRLNWNGRPWGSGLLIGLAGSPVGLQPPFWFFERQDALEHCILSRRGCLGDSGLRAQGRTQMGENVFPDLGLHKTEAGPTLATSPHDDEETRFLLYFDGKGVQQNLDPQPNPIAVDCVPRPPWGRIGPCRDCVARQCAAVIGSFYGSSTIRAEIPFMMAGRFVRSSRSASSRFHQEMDQR